jgi:hypothetical protein
MQAPLIITPFISTDYLVQVKPKRNEDTKKAHLVSDILNYQYKNEFNSLEFIRQIASILPKEGTVVVKTGWEYKTVKSDELNISDISEEQLQNYAELQSQYKVFKLTKGKKKKTYNIKAYNETIIKNRPTAVVCKNESIYTDPLALNFEDAKFVIHTYEKTISDIKSQKNIYNIEADIDLSDIKNEPEQTPLYNKRNETIETLGYDKDYSSSYAPNKKLTLVDYWGEYDINGDGINESVIITWVKGTDTILRCEENPFPDGEIPFVSCTYNVESFAVWGNSVADLAYDTQRIRTALMRSYIENIASSSNGQVFVGKYAMDNLAEDAYLKGKRVVRVNNIDQLMFGNYNQIPPSIFNIYSMLDSEVAQLTGVSQNTIGSVSPTIGRTAGGVNSVITTAQSSTRIVVLAIANMYKDMFNKWQKYNSVFLEKEQEFLIAGNLASVEREEITSASGYNVEININLEADNQNKLQQINMFLQQAQYFRGDIPPETIKLLVSELFTCLGKYEEAQGIIEWQPQPTPQQQALEQIQIETAAANLDLLKAQAEEHRARARNAVSQATGHRYKAAKTSEEIRKIAEETDFNESTRGLDILKKGAEIDATANKNRDRVQN